MNKKISIKTISISDLWNVLRSCYIIIIVVAILVTALFYVKAKLDYTPLYSSTATLYLLGTNESGTSTNQWAADFTLANVIIDDSTYLLTSRTVLNKLGEQLGVSNGYGAFKSGISINNPEGTRVLEVTAVSYSPEMAKQIVDGVCELGTKSINDVLDYDQLHVFEAGSYNPYPSNTVSLSSYVKYGIIAGAAVYIVFLAIFLFDTYIHTAEDVERYLGLSVLGEIPEAGVGKRKSKYSYSKGAYGKKSYYGTKSQGGGK